MDIIFLALPINTIKKFSIKNRMIFSILKFNFKIFVELDLKITLKEMAP